MHAVLPKHICCCLWQDTFLPFELLFCATEDETPVRRKSNSQKQSKNSSDDEEEMEVEDEDCNSSGDDDDDDDDHVDNMDDETDGSEAEMDGSFFTGDDDDDGDDDGDDSEFEDEDNIEDGDGTRLKINEKSVTGSKSDADEKTRRLKALADFVGTASSEEAEVKGILKDKSRTSSKNKDPKQVQFSVLSPNVRTDNKDVVTSADEDLHEDIYGRLRDERGNVVGTVGDQQSSGGVYVPPGKRQQQLERKTEGEDETRKSLANVMLLRQLKGQINRLVSRGFALQRFFMVVLNGSLSFSLMPDVLSTIIQL